MIGKNIPLPEVTIVENKKENAFSSVWDMIFKLRSVILAFPVAVGAVALAVYNQINLPDYVGISFLASGEYAQVVHKSIAVFGPVAVTAVCLLLMFCSRKVLYPWLISLFSLVLPLVILLTNLFPG